MLRSISSFPNVINFQRQPAKPVSFSGRQESPGASSHSSIPSSEADDEFIFASSSQGSGTPFFSVSPFMAPIAIGLPPGNNLPSSRMQVVIELPAGMSIHDIPPQIFQQIFAPPPMMRRPDPALAFALQNRDFGRIQSLLNQGGSLKPSSLGGSFSDVLLSMRPNHATELVNGLRERNIIPEHQLKRLLSNDIYSNYELEPQDRQQLIELSNITPTRINGRVFKQVMQERVNRFSTPPFPKEQVLLERIAPVWDGLSLRHKRMIDDAVQELSTGSLHMVPEPFSLHEGRSPMPIQRVMNFFSSSVSGGEQSITSIPNSSMDEIWTGSHFGAGLKTIPRLLGLVQSLEFMSQRPTKNYRWFTEGLNRGVPAYSVPNFYEKFPRGVRGVYSRDYIKDLGSNFTDDFSLAMSTLKQRNDGRITANTLHNADIGFTLDNGDGHDVACRIKFRRDFITGKLTGQLAVIDSYPKHLQEIRRPGQDRAFRNLDSLVQAYFTSVLGWDQKDVPAMKTQVIYMNNQINGYCTSNAVDHMLADGLNESLSVTHPAVPGWATTARMSEGQASSSGKGKASQGKTEEEPEVLDSANTTFFIKRTLDKLNQARLVLSLPDYQTMPSSQKRRLQEGLAQVYGAMRMDQVNTAEGRVFDYHDTRLANQPWRAMVTEAEREYEQEPFWQRHFDNKKSYVGAKVAESIVKPVQIEDKLRLMDARQINYFRSLQQVEKDLEQARK